jgi:hypothetical protein
MSAAFCHLLELPPKMRYEPSLYVRLHRTLYPNFGRISGPVEAASVVTASALAWNLRNRRRPAKLAAAAAGCLAAAHAIFWTTVQPANQTMFTWKLDAIPQEWIGWRNQWEYSHAARAVLVTAALAMLAAEAVNESRR